MTERRIYKYSILGAKGSGSVDPVTVSYIVPAAATTSGGHVLNSLYLQPCAVSIPGAITRTINARVNVTSSGASSNVVRVGLYSIHPVTYVPHELIVDGGTASSTSGGEKVISFSVTNLPAYFFVGFVTQVGTACTITTASGNTNMITTHLGRTITVSDSVTYAAYVETGVTGALPSTSSATLQSISGGIGSPAVILEIP